MIGQLGGPFVQTPNCQVIRWPYLLSMANPYKTDSLSVFTLFKSIVFCDTAGIRRPI